MSAVPTRWRNWAGNQHCAPDRIARPLTEDQLQHIVAAATHQGRRVRAVGSGHSFTAIACTDDVMVSLEHLNMVKRIDPSTNLVTVQAGIELTHLNTRLAQAGLAMTNLGDIAYQSLAGAVSTGTHGTGLPFTGIASQIRHLRIVNARGEIIECDPATNSEIFHSARVGLGAFGIISEMTIEVERAFNLHAIEEPRTFTDTVARWDVDVAEHDHYEFFWIPGTDTAMTKINRRTDDPVDRQPRLKQFTDKIIGENVAFGAMTRLGRIRPSLIPRFRSAIIGSIGEADYTDTSFRVFASRRWVKFVEMEYSVPVGAVPEVLEEIERAVVDAKIELLFPVEVRAAAGDDIPLSTASGRDSGYIAVHRGKGYPFRKYFELVEAIMHDFEGRPHWGKLHFQTAATLAPRYPQWDRFQEARAGADPDGVFGNAYTDRVLG